jgi:type IX secretion system PorP/SprF family membrane protein
MKKLIFFVSIICAAARLQAQQEHHYTQFMYNKLLLNPAYAGARGVPALTAIYRNQWLGFEGSPQSALLSFHSPFLSNRFGAGVTISHQKAGLNRDFFGNLAFSYDLIAQEELSVRMGVMGSMRSLSISFGDATPVNNGDPSLENDRVNEIYGNVGAGIYATVAGQFFAGFSVPRIYSNTIGFNPNQPPMIAKEYQHYYASAGAIIPLSDDINLMPSALLKYVKNAPFDADVNLSLDVRKKFTAGLSYRIGGDGSGESIDLLAYWQASPQLAVGFAYDFTLSQIKDYTAGSIELLVQADLKKRKRSRNMSNPRFFL